MASEGATWSREGFDGAEEPQIEHSEEHVQDLAQDSHVPDDAAADGQNGQDDAEDGGDYDPETVALEAAPQAPDKEASSTPVQPPATVSKPKVAGGFLVEVSDDDDDDDDDEGEGGNTPAAQDQAKANIAAGTKDDTSTPAPTAAPVGAPAMASLDPVALLEARIKEDPRGDMDAWVNLMADHRRRGRLDGLRAVYGRFLEVFPQAVRTLPSAVPAVS